MTSRFTKLQVFMAFVMTLPSVAAAQSVGIKFDQIVVGSEYHYSETGIIGDTAYIQKYMGVQNGRHVMNSYFLKNRKRGDLFRIDYFDQAGRLVQRDRLNFKTRFQYRPFHCDRSGQKTCQHRSIRIDTKTGKIEADSVQHWETNLRGRVLHIVRNANANRLKSELKLDDQNIMVERKERVKVGGGKSKLSRTIRTAVGVPKK